MNPPEPASEPNPRPSYQPLTIAEQFEVDGKHPILRCWYWENRVWHSMCILKEFRKRRYRKSQGAHSLAEGWYSMTSGTVVGALQAEVGHYGIWMERNGKTAPERIVDSLDMESMERIPGGFDATCACSACGHGYGRYATCDCADSPRWFGHCPIWVQQH